MCVWVCAGVCVFVGVGVGVRPCHLEEPTKSILTYLLLEIDIIVYSAILNVAKILYKHS